jgi:5-methylcytosine-specific restriction protein A
MDFEVTHRTKTDATLEPLSARILHSDEAIDLRERFANIARDFKELKTLQATYPKLARAISNHYQVLRQETNTADLRVSADGAIALQAQEFGATNLAAVTTITELPPTSLEDDIKGREGRILTRLHSYRERDRTLVKKAKALFKAARGSLFCECCGFRAETFYGERGQDRIQAHHRRPVEELLAESVTKAEDLAMVCPNCHDIIHAKRPWITVEELKDELSKRGKYYA